MTRTSVLIAVTGGSPLLRSALCLALTASEAEFEGREAADPCRARTAAEGRRPVRRPCCCWRTTGGDDVRQEMSRLVTAMEDVPIVVVAPGASIAGVTRTLEAGAKGLVPHSESMRELTAALGFVIDGGVYIPAGALIAAPEPPRPPRKSRGAGAGTGTAVERLETLTDRQRQIVEHVAAGMSNREIAEALGIREGDGEGPRRPHPGKAGRRQPPQKQRSPWRKAGRAGTRTAYRRRSTPRGQPGAADPAPRVPGPSRGAGSALGPQDRSRPPCGVCSITGTPPPVVEPPPPGPGSPRPGGAAGRVRHRRRSPGSAAPAGVSHSSPAAARVPIADDRRSTGNIGRGAVDRLRLRSERHLAGAGRQRDGEAGDGGQSGGGPDHARAIGAEKRASDHGPRIIGRNRSTKP